MPWNKTDLSFKTLQNRRVTDSDGKYYYNEKSDITLHVHNTDIWAEVIPGTPPVSSTSIIQVRTLLTLVEDQSVPNKHTWFATTNAVTVSSQTDEAARLKDWVSDKYNNGGDYSIKLFDSSNVEIPLTDASDWHFNYQTGILTFNSPTMDTGTIASRAPFKITGYRYIGRKGSTVSIGGINGVKTDQPGNAPIVNVGNLQLDLAYEPVWTGNHIFNSTIAVKVNSDLAFLVENAAGSSNAFSIDTNHTSVGIGTDTPYYSQGVKFEVAGSISQQKISRFRFGTTLGTWRNDSAVLSLPHPGRLINTNANFANNPVGTSTPPSIITGYTLYNNLGYYVESITVDNSGTGYVSAPTVSFLNPNGGNSGHGYCEANIVSGGVDTIDVVRSGGTYTTDPIVVITGDGTGATADAHINNGLLSIIIVLNGGSGYTIAPTVVLGGGSGGVATANISGGAVVSITINSFGSGYSVGDPISLVGGDGVGATAYIQRVISGSISSVTVTNPGSGYSTAVVSLYGGGLLEATANPMTGGIFSITIDTPQSVNYGYSPSAIPTVILSGGGGSGVLTTVVLAQAVNLSIEEDNSLTLPISPNLPNSVPNNTNRYMKVSYTGGGAVAPGLGGFFSNINVVDEEVTNFGQYRRGDRIMFVLWAKIPIGYTLQTASNGTGVGAAEYWLTPQTGTGAWQQYIRIRVCGEEDNFPVTIFSNTGHFYLSGPDVAMDWAVGSCSAYAIDNINSDTINALNIGNKLDIDIPYGGLLTTNQSYLATNLGNVYIGTDTPISTARLTINSSSSSNVVMKLFGASSQTANLLELRSDSDAILSFVNASGRLALGSTTIVANAMLQINSTDKGILIPRMTDAQRNSISSPSSGLTVYTTDENAYSYWNGTAWVLLKGFPIGVTPVVGTGVAGRVAFWTGTSTIGENSVFTWDNSNSRLGIGTSSADFTLDVGGDIRVEGANKIYFGGTGPTGNDVNLYRSGADILKTDDNLYVTGNFTLETGDFYTSDQTYTFETSFPDGYVSLALIPNGTSQLTAIQLFNDSDESNSGIIQVNSRSDGSFPTIHLTHIGSGTTPDFLVKQDSNTILYSPFGGVGLTIGDTSTPGAVLHAVGTTASTPVIMATGAVSQTADVAQWCSYGDVIMAAITSNGQLVFGPSGSQDTTLYRSAANTLKTDGVFLAATGIGINAVSLLPSAILQIDSTIKGFLPPRMNNTQRDAISSPATGLVLYSTTDNALEFWNGSSWLVGISTPSIGGTIHKIPKWTSSTSLGDSIMTESGGSINISGGITATSKSFVIPHPTKLNKKLVYGSLEGPEHGAYHRGRIQGRGEIRVELPEYWHKLVQKAYTIHLTAHGNYNVYVTDQDENGFTVRRCGWLINRILLVDFSYYVVGCRLDVSLEIEQDYS